MIVIELTQGQVTYVDDVDSDLVNQSWQATYNPHTQSYYARDRNSVRLHRTILSRILGVELKPNQLVDHIDHNTLNNCRDNLRLADNSKNQWNSNTNRNSKSGFKGVTWHKGQGRWRARISVNSVAYELGYFDDPVKAAKAYDKAAIDSFGEFAYTNFSKDRCQSISRSTIKVV